MPEMKCPKCGSGDTQKSTFLDIWNCNNCEVDWTDWQQDLLAEKDREIERLKAERDSLLIAPLCGKHAEIWFCERDRIKAESGCWICDLAERIERLTTALSQEAAADIEINKIVSDQQATIESLTAERDALRERCVKLADHFIHCSDCSDCLEEDSGITVKDLNEWAGPIEPPKEEACHD